MSLGQLIADYFDKAKSHIYGLFVFWIIFFHAKIFFVSLFVDQDIIFKKTGLLKNEYISQNFLNYRDFSFWLYELSVAGAAILLTFLMIWVLPKTIIKKAYQQELQDQFEREELKFIKEQELLTKQSKLVEKQSRLVKQKQEVAKKEQDIASADEKKWQKEYEEFANSQRRHLINTVIDIAYGSRQGYYSRSPLTANDLAYLETSEIINLDRKNMTLEPTEKGRYFIGRFQSGR